jgi:hypothetical protein
MVLQVLDDFDPQIKVMGSVTVNEFTHVLSLVGALLDDLAVVLEQVVDEELVELLGGTLLVLVHLLRQTLAEEERVHEAVLLRTQLLQDHQQVRVEYRDLVRTLVKGLHDCVEL